MSQIAIISGSSGLVGTQLLHQLFQHPAYDWVISLGRRELALKHSKLIQVKVDFKKLEKLDLIEKIKENDLGGKYHNLVKQIQTQPHLIHVFSALGTTLKDAGSKDNFYQIDHDFVINFARWAFGLGAEKFLYVSAIGADAQSTIFYNKVKGEIEEDLKRIDFKYVGIFQPSLLLGNRKTNRLGEEVGKVLMRGITFLGLFKKYKPIYDHQVAKAMVKKALENGLTGNETISSTEMHQMIS
ncbi:MAG: NAD-dependent epimerase/dehydratase family protein [Cyclobacteriaceae bacterium]